MTLQEQVNIKVYVVLTDKEGRLAQFLINTGKFI